MTAPTNGPGQHVVVMPSVEVGMETAKLGGFLVSPGDHVRRGQPLFTVEADKIDMDVEALQAGVVVALLVSPGDDVRVGEPVLLLDTACAE